MANLEDCYKITNVSPVEKSEEILREERRAKPLTVGAMEDMLQVTANHILNEVRLMLKGSTTSDSAPKLDESVFRQIEEKFGEKN